MNLLYVVVGSLAIPVISCGVTILSMAIRKRNNMAQRHYRTLYREGEMSGIIVESRALFRRNSPARDDATESFFDILTKGEAVSEGESING